MANATHINNENGKTIRVITRTSYGVKFNYVVNGKDYQGVKNTTNEKFDKKFRPI